MVLSFILLDFRQMQVLPEVFCTVKKNKTSSFFQGTSFQQAIFPVMFIT